LGTKKFAQEPQGSQPTAESAVDTPSDDLPETAITRAIAFGRKLRAQTLQAVSPPLSAAQQQDPATEEFLDQLSHELRTPLTSIRSFSEILVNHPDLSPRQRAHYLRIILEESERLESVLNEKGA